MAQAPLSIAVSNKVGTSDLRSLVAAAKAQPGRLNFAVGSVGSAGHLCTARLEQAAGISLSIVPYKGTAPAFQDLIGGQIEGLDPDRSCFAMGQSAGGIHEVLPAAEIVARLVSGAEAAIDRLSALRATQVTA